MKLKIGIALFILGAMSSGCSFFFETQTLGSNLLLLCGFMGIGVGSMLLYLVALGKKI